MPTNDERRKIAETLRSGVGTTDYMSDGAFIEWLFRVIGRSCDGHILDPLATLIRARGADVPSGDRDAGTQPDAGHAYQILLIMRLRVRI